MINTTIQIKEVEILTDESEYLGKVIIKNESNTYEALILNSSH